MAVYYGALLIATLFYYRELSEMNMIHFVILLLFPLLIGILIYDIVVCVRGKTNKTET